MAIQSNFPAIRPTLDLNFASSRTVDSRIAFTRASTATYFDEFGVMRTAPANTPRIDFDPVTGECKGLLIEESRTNLLTYSEQFQNAAWTTANVTVHTDAVVAPDGTLTSDKIVENATTGFHAVSRSITSSKATHAISCYIKAGGRTSVEINIYDGPAGTTKASVFFDLSSGTVLKQNIGTGSIQSVGNGWYRCAVITSSELSSGSSTCYIRITQGTNLSYSGDGYSGIYIWGAQLETGDFHTSYIKTESSQVTRAADNASMTGANFSSWYRQDEGAMQAVFSAPNAESSLAKHVFAARGSGSEEAASRVGLLTVNNNSRAQFFVTTNNIVQCQLIAQSSYSGVFNVVGAYKENDFAAAGSGFSLSTDTSGTTPRVAEAIIGLNLNGHIKRLTYYPKRLSNQQLQALTL